MDGSHEVPVLGLSRLTKRGRYRTLRLTTCNRENPFGRIRAHRPRVEWHEMAATTLEEPWSQSPVHRTGGHIAVPWQGKTHATAAMQDPAVFKENKNNNGKQTRLVRSKSKNGNTKRTCQETTTPSASGEPDVFKVLTHECRRPLITHRHKDPPSARQALGLSKWAREMGDRGDSCVARLRFLVREEAEYTPARVSMQLTASPRDDSL
jgi:hypothetical protein